MIESLRQVVAELVALPEYFCKSLIELLVIVVGGIVVGWITSTYFATKAAEADVKGDIMKKKLDICETLVAKLDAMMQQVVLPSSVVGVAVDHLKKNNMAVEYAPQYPIPEVFQTGRKLTDVVLDIDRYISANRIYFDSCLYDSLQFFQNYIIIFRRLIVVYEEQFVDAAIPLDNKAVCKFENLTAIELGLILQDELAEEIETVCDSIRQSIVNISSSVNASPDHSARRFGVDGPILQKLLDMKIMTERQNIMRLITENVAMGMVAVGHKP